MNQIKSYLYLFCEEFYRFLAFYPGILFLLPGLITDLDPIFKRLSFINMDIVDRGDNVVG